MLVCLPKRFFDSGEKTARPTETGEIPFDAPEREKDDGAHCRAIGPNQHVARAAACTNARFYYSAQQITDFDMRQNYDRRGLKPGNSLLTIGRHMPLW